MCTLHAFLDTGAVLNLVHSNMLPLGWRHAFNTQTPLPKLCDANRRPLKLLGVVNLRFRLINAHYRVDFFVGPTLAAPLIIGTSFMDQHVDGVVEKVCGSIRILGRNKVTMRIEEVEVDKVQSPKTVHGDGANGTRTPLRSLQTIHVPPMTQFTVMVRCNLSGMVHKEPKHSVFVNHRLNITNRVHKSNSDISFMILVAVFSNTGCKITKHIIIGYATRNPTLIIPLRPD